MATKSGKLAGRYARALLRATREMMGTEYSAETSLQIAQSLERFVVVWKTDPNLSFYIISPMYDRIQRLNALLAVARAVALPEMAEKFLTVVFERDRIVALPEIVSAYREFADKQAGLVHIQIKTANSVEGEEKAIIEKRITEKISGIPVFDWQVDRKLLGGIVVMYQGKVLDGSLSGKLQQLAETLQR